MSTTKLLIAEISYRKLNFALCLLAVTVSAALFVAAPTLATGYGNKTDQLAEAQQTESEEKLSNTQAENQQKLADKRAALDVELKKVVEKNEARLAKLRKETAMMLAKLDKQTKRTMRDLGFNLRIVHRDTDMSRFYLNFESHDMPEEYLKRLANSPILTKVVHLVPSIRSTITWEGRKRLLVGYAPEATQTHIEKKLPMGFVIKPNTVYLGHEAAVGHKLGETITIEKREFKIARILPETANETAVTIFMNLKDAQAVLGKQGKLSEILALGCKCTTINRISEIRAQLEKVLPETKVTEWHSKAEAREKQRDLVAAQRKALLSQQEAADREIIEQMKTQHRKILADLKRGNAKTTKKEKDDGAALLAGLRASRQGIQNTMESLRDVVTPLVILVSAIMLCVIMWNNVRERREEIGLLRALGKRTADIAGLFLGKAVLLGLIGGAAGCVVGLVVAWGVGRSMEFELTTMTGGSAELLGATLLGAPLIAALAAYLPTRTAIAQDPAVVLMEQ